MTKLRMEMRVGERRPISEFNLDENETLAERVTKELASASERGDLSGMSVKATIPSIAVFSVSDEEGTPDGSIALFSAAGVEVTHRDYRVAIGTDAKGQDVVQVTGIDQVEENGETKDVDTVLGVFYNEDMARRVGSLWKAGVLD